MTSILLLVFLLLQTTGSYTLPSHSEVVENVICENGSSCPNGFTCCKLGTECCPYENAVCCSDGKCCPNDYFCQDDGTCTDRARLTVAPLSLLTDKTQQAHTHSAGIPKVKDNKMCNDNVTECPEKSTCCKISDRDIYSCCPAENAVCCDYNMTNDPKCCPNNYKCNYKDGTCEKEESGQLP